MKQGLQILTQNQLVPISKGQNALLNLITDCVTNKTVLTMAEIVDCYCRCVRKNYYHPWDAKPIEYMVRDEFKKQSHVWTYRLRGLIKAWFINTMGNLVLKGKLIVLPIIEVEL